MRTLRASWEIDFATLVTRIVATGIQPKAIARMLDVSPRLVSDWKTGWSEPNGRCALGLVMIHCDIAHSHICIDDAIPAWSNSAMRKRATLANAETAGRHHAQLLRLYSERALCKLLKRSATVMRDLEQHQRCSVETARRLAVAYRVHQRLLEALR